VGGQLNVLRSENPLPTILNGCPYASNNSRAVEWVSFLCKQQYAKYRSKQLWSLCEALVGSMYFTLITKQVVHDS